ncbi:MAG: hypothetical protein KDA78_20630, partial [Planctomycetaceae bacterium]|nr:hypothetical protein [Planctomycetaceae bacterium]
MPDARSLFSAEDHSRITAAVVSAESKTAAEIVPVVANISGKYERAEDSVGVWGSLIAVSIAWLCAPHPVLETGDWSGAHPTTHLVLLLVSLLVGFIAGTSIGAQLSGLKQLFTSKDQMAEEV